MAGRYDLVIVGAGSAGLAAADLAVELGLRTALVERHRVGGDCLWTGCVPSKALLAAARAAHTVRHAKRFGLEADGPRVDLARVLASGREVQDAIAATDDHPDRLRERGIDVHLGPARLVDPHTVEVDGTRLPTRHVLVCTGSRPALPPIPGIDGVDVLTSDSIWSLDALPRSLVVLGGGPIGCELAQAFGRLGSEVTLVETQPRLLPADDPDAAAVLARVLAADGVRVRNSTTATRVEGGAGGPTVHVEGPDGVAAIDADAILVATGRHPNVDGLGLEDLGVEVGSVGITVDDRLHTGVASIYAAGDVAGRWQFTHSAAYEASIALRNMVFPLSAKADAPIPWCTYTDPEVAHVGLTVDEARARHGRRVEVHRRSLHANDRARAERATDGFVQVVTVRGRVVGADVVSPNAGDLVNEMALAVRERVRLDRLAFAVHTYPTVSLDFFRLGGEAAVRRAKRLGWLIRRER